MESRSIADAVKLDPRPDEMFLPLVMGEEVESEPLGRLIELLQVGGLAFVFQQEPEFVERDEMLLIIFDKSSELFPCRRDLFSQFGRFDGCRASLAAVLGKLAKVVVAIALMESIPGPFGFRFKPGADQGDGLFKLLNLKG